MPLPKISTPTYELVLPSNNKKVKYRPFLVREEKILILALESNDSKQVSDAIVDILSSCILTKNIANLSLLLTQKVASLLYPTNDIFEQIQA